MAEAVAAAVALGLITAATVTSELRLGALADLAAGLACGAFVALAVFVGSGRFERVVAYLNVRATRRAQADGPLPSRD